MNSILQNIDIAGRAFIELIWPMMIQSSVLVLGLFLIESFGRRRIRPASLYWIWMLALAAIVVPVGYLAREAAQYWPGIITAQADTIPVIVEENQTLSAAQPGAAQYIEAQPVVTWQGMLFAGWILCVLSFVAWLVYRIVKVRRLIVSARDANGFMQDTLRYCCKCLGVKRKVGFKVSVQIKSPIVWGLLNPVIVIPHDLAPTLGARHLRAVLLHEIAHIKRGDLWANLFQTVLQVLYFFNPVVWFTNWMIRRIREQAANHTVIDKMGTQSPWYMQTLADVTDLKFRPPVLGIALVSVEEPVVPTTHKTFRLSA